MSGIQIRRTTAADGEALRDIRLAALQNEPDAYGSTYNEAISFTDSQWSEMAAERVYFLAFDGPRPIGMASGGLFPPYPHAHWLYGMFVQPEFRGTGVATQLVDAVVTWAKSEGATTLGLHVTTSLPRPRAFYAKCGFVPDGKPEPMGRDHRLTLQTMLRPLS